MESTFVSEAYVQHREPLYGYLLSLTREREAAEDAVQESFARLTREVNAGRAPDNTRAWLFRVGRNLITSAGRRAQVAQRLEPRLALHDVGLSAEEQYLACEQQRTVHGALASLGDIDRRLLMMAALGYSGREIGTAIGRNENAVRTRLCRARSRIRAYVDRELPASA